MYFIYKLENISQLIMNDDIKCLQLLTRACFVCMPSEVIAHLFLDMIGA
jgi:hypothetical protein